MNAVRETTWREKHAEIPGLAERSRSLWRARLLQAVLAAALMLLTRSKKRRLAGWVMRTTGSGMGMFLWLAEVSGSSDPHCLLAAGKVPRADIDHLNFEPHALFLIV